MITQQIAIFILGVLIGISTIAYFIEFLTLQKFTQFRERILRHREVEQYMFIKKQKKKLKNFKVYEVKKIYKIFKQIADMENQLKITRNELNALQSLEEK